MKDVEPFRHSKISVPHVAKYLPRHRLFEQIRLSGDSAAIWIEAPPGSGKTTLASSYLDHSQRSHIWYQVDSSDHDLASFFYWLGLAILKAVQENDKSLPLFTAEYSFGIETYSRNFFDELYSRLQAPFTLIFDNYQLLPADSPVHDVMTLAIECLPAGGNILILSREKPPQQYTRLLTNRHLGNIGWEQLRLQKDELGPLLEVLTEADVGPDKQQQLMDMSDGWISGVVLILLSHKLKIGYNNLPKKASPEMLFDYFTNEIMAAQSDDTNRFLRALALLPQFDLEMSADLSGNKNAEDIINFLLARNYFLSRLSGNKPRYEFHPLFREYLLTQGGNCYSDDEWRQMKQAATGILEKDQQYGHMLALLVEIGDIPNAVRILCEQAMILIMQGRHETIRQWISLFPMDIIGQIPWLSYWKGISLLAVNPFESIVVLEECYPQFKQQKDIIGMYLTWCAIVDAYTYAVADFTPAGKWVEELDWLRSEYPDYPSPEIEARVTFCAVFILMWRQPDHPSYQQWLQIAIAMQENIPVNDLSIQGLVTLSHALCIHGRIRESSQIVESMDNRISTDTVSPGVFIWTTINKCLLGSFGVGKYNNVSRMVEETAEYSNKHGISVLFPTLYGINVFYDVQVNNPEHARARLREIEKTVDPQRKLEYSQFKYMQGMTCLCEGDYLAAEKAYNTALLYAKRGSLLYPEVLCCCGLALVCIELGKADDANKFMQKAYDFGKQTHSPSIVYYAEAARAYALLKAGDTERADSILKVILPCMKQHELGSCPSFYARSFAKLAARAYQTGIETEFVDKIVKHFGITPYDEQDRVDAWPWPCRINLFGSYRIELQGEEVGSGSKSAKKPKELLLALLTAPQQTLSVKYVADLLWPDADGDSARITLKTTLHRLRKLLADDRYIKVHDGQLQLDSSRLLCDAVEFDRASMRLDKANGQSQHELEKMILLYQGELADGSDDCYWLHNMRERYRNQFIYAISRLGGLKHKNGDTNQAIEVFHKGLNVDSLAEELYAGLMACYLSTGSASQGLKVYALCRRNLKSRLAITPAESTQKIARQLDALASAKNRDQQ